MNLQIYNNLLQSVKKFLIKYFFLFQSIFMLHQSFFTLIFEKNKNNNFSQIMDLQFKIKYFKKSDYLIINIDHHYL